MSAATAAVRVEVEASQDHLFTCFGRWPAGGGKLIIERVVSGTVEDTRIEEFGQQLFASTIAALNADDAETAVIELYDLS